LGEFVIGHRLSRLDYRHSGGTSDGTCTDAEGSITSALVGAATQKDLLFPVFFLKTDFKDYQKPHPTGLNCIPMAPKPQFVFDCSSVQCLAV